jgi:hypothetical protein
MKNRLLLLLALAVVACGRKASLVIPEIPDYTLPANWYHLDRGTGADLLYISSTEVADRALKDGRVRHFASVTDSADRAALLAEYNGVDRLLSDGKLNFYGPYYRQMTLETYLSQEDVRSRVAVPLQDIRAAFDYYMAHENKGKPFILAGFSQGAQMTLELLKAMPDSVYSRMVAAYIIGWPVTPEDRKAAKSRHRRHRLLPVGEVSLRRQSGNQRHELHRHQSGELVHRHDVGRLLRFAHRPPGPCHALPAGKRL